MVATYLSCCYKLVFSQQLRYCWEKLVIPTIIIVAANSLVFLQQPFKVAGKPLNYFFLCVSFIMVSVPIFMRRFLLI